MSQCTNTKIGQMLHNYELGLLSDEDKKRFELHLYECDHCAGQVREFNDVTRYLLADEAFKGITSKIAREGEADSKPRKFTTVFRYLVAATLVLAVAFTVYKIGIYKETPRVTQTIELNPARMATDNTIYLADGGDVEIKFFVADGFEGTLDLTIVSLTGDTILSRKDFSGYAATGIGKVQLRVSRFVAGYYILTATPDSLSGVPTRVYMFRVK